MRATLQIVDINALPDPCPLPHTVKKRGLNDKERLLYAPMADVGGLLYDKDAVYIDIPDWKVGLHCFSQFTCHPGGYHGNVLGTCECAVMQMDCAPAHVRRF